MVLTSVVEGEVLGGLDREEGSLERFFAWLGKWRAPSLCRNYGFATVTIRESLILAISKLTLAGINST